jgi:aspartate/methionine/tyrosine aminotransferase
LTATACREKSKVTLPVTFVSEEDFVLRLLSDDGVLVHPGYFFDFPTESYCIVSLIQAEREFSEGVERLLRRAMSPDEPPRPRSARRAFRYRT